MNQYVADALPLIHIEIQYVSHAVSIDCHADCMPSKSFGLTIYEHFKHHIRNKKDVCLDTGSTVTWIRLWTLPNLKLVVL